MHAKQTVDNYLSYILQVLILGNVTLKFLQVIATIHPSIIHMYILYTCMYI